VLAATLSVDDYLDLEALKQPPPYPVFDPLSVGAPPSPPRESDFAVEGPSALGRVFAASKHAARAEQRQAEYEQALYGYRAAAQKHSQRLEEARLKHGADVARLAEQHRQKVEEISALQRGLAARQPDAVVRYLDLVLEAADYPDGFPHSWRLAYAAASGHLAIEYELPQMDVVPNDKAYKYVKSSDTISPTARPTTQIRSIYAETLRQTALRVVHEVLEADRGGAVRTIVFNGYADGTNPATGREVRPCLVALATSRERFMEVDLARVDTVACLAHLEARVSKDPSKLQPVEPIVLTGSLEADYTLSTNDEPDPSPARPTVFPLVNERPSSAQVSEHHELVAGQNVPLAGPRVQVDLLASHADLSVLLVGASGRVDRDEDFIFYNNPRSADGALTLTANGASVDTALLPQHCERVILVVSAGDGGSIADATAVLHQPGGAIDLRFRPVDSASVSALVWGELYQRNGNWRLRAVGQGWFDGLAGLARDYGVNVD
jgi:stress response protein SCP2